MSERILSKGKPFIADISCLDFTPTGAKRQVNLWREMIVAGIKVPPIKVRPKTDMPGRYSIFSGAVAVEAALLEGFTSIEVELV